MMQEMQEALLKLGLAFVMGALIGIERETHGRAAGMRTHILVCLGSTLLTMTSIYIFELYEGRVPADPARIAAGAITGIGFLGAGTIMRFRASVVGLTTAASLWTIAAVGLAIGVGYYDAACLTVVFVLVTLLCVGVIERKLIRKTLYKVLLIEVTDTIEALQSVKKVLAGYQAELYDVEIERVPPGGTFEVQLTLRLAAWDKGDTIISEIAHIQGVRRAHWQ